MTPKPSGLTPAYAAQFSDPSVVAAYHHRPPYPDEVFEVLESLLPAGARTVLDIGCGTGDIARPLARRVARVDAVDISKPMIALGRALPGGDASNLHWKPGRVEKLQLDRTFGMVTAGESLHWMDWVVVLPLLGRLLVSNGFLVILDRHVQPQPWFSQIIESVQRYSTNRDYVPYDLVNELVTAGLFTPLGSQRTHPVQFSQSITDYIESWHSRNGLSRDRMAPDAATAFDAEARAAVQPASRDGVLELHTTVEMTWGRPIVAWQRKSRLFG